MIEKASMDGTSRQSIHYRGLHSPTALALDTQTQTLYWIDTSLDKVESSSVNGSNRQLIFQTVRDPFGIAVHINGIYFSQRNGSTIKFISSNPNSNESAAILYTSFICKRPLGIQIVDPLKQLQGQYVVGENWPVIQYT